MALAATAAQVAAIRERDARTRKARALVDVVAIHLPALGIDTLEPARAAEIVRMLPEGARRSCADLAGVRPPSPATWAIVAGLIRNRLEHPAPADPFEGLPQ